MIVWKLTQKEFLAGTAVLGSSALSPFVAIEASMPDPAWVRGTEFVLASNPGFATALLLTRRDSFADQALLQLTPRDDWEFVGVYMGDVLVLRPDVTGRGLSTELILRCAVHRQVPTQRQMTPEGEGALRRAHRASVTAAVDAGLPVPAVVRTDYGL